MKILREGEVAIGELHRVKGMIIPQKRLGRDTPTTSCLAPSFYLTASGWPGGTLLPLWKLTRASLAILGGFTLPFPSISIHTLGKRLDKLLCCCITCIKTKNSLISSKDIFVIAFVEK